MTERQISKSSRLRFSELLDDEVPYWDLPEFPQLSAQPDDVTHQVEGSETIARIAAKRYGDPRLWWVICLANDIEIPSAELHEGDILRIPSPRYVREELFKAAVQR